MTKQQKINDLLSWVLEGCNISARNEASLRRQFAEKSEAEIDSLYAAQMRRRIKLEG